MDEQQHTDASPLRRRLGRGLNSLLGVGSPAVSEEQIEVQEAAHQTGEFLQLPVDTIERNPFQPRRDFEAEALQELVESVATHGVLQPLLVRRVGGGFQLIAGERRLIASRRAGLPTVPCRVVDLDDRDVSEVAIIENLQRADLNELEKALAFQDYVERYGCTIEDLARRLGKDRSTISNCLRLLELPDPVKLALQSGKISAGHARALLPLDEEAEQVAFCQRIQEESLNVRQTEEMVRERNRGADVVPYSKGAKSSDAATAKPTNNHILSLQDQIRDLVGAKIEIKMKGKNAGRLIIHFDSNEEFERVVQVLRKAA